MYISPSVSARAQTVYGNKNWNTSISGTGDRYPEVRNWDVEFGTYFDETMVKSAAKVCVLGADVKTNLFEDEDPIGKVIRIKKIPFKVLGVLKKRGESGGFGSRDDMIAIPYTTAMRRLQGIDYIQSVDVRAVSTEADAPGRRSRSRSSCGSGTASPPARRTTSPSATCPRSPRRPPRRPR